jgi:hypothetical protein
VAVLALLIVTAVTVAACAWNARRLPVPTRARRATWVGTRVLRPVIASLVARHPLTRAGFSFTVQTLARSTSHRIGLALALAVGVGFGLVMTGSEMRQGNGMSGLPLRALAAQTLVLAAMVAGVRRAVNVPAGLGANWIFQIAWRGDLRPYARGVQRASAIAVLVPVVLGSALWHTAGMGLPLAAIHGVVGLVLALIALEVAFLNLRRLPFACSYTSGGNAAGVVTVGALVLVAAFIVAAVERTVLARPLHTAILMMVLLATWVCLGLVGTLRTHSEPGGGMDDEPEFPTQRLDLAG